MGRSLFSKKLTFDWWKVLILKLARDAQKMFLRPSVQTILCFDHFGKSKFGPKGAKKCQKVPLFAILLRKYMKSEVLRPKFDVNL